MKVLFVAPAVPFPPDSGGRVRTRALLGELAPRAEIHFRAVLGGPDDAAGLAELARTLASARGFERSAPGPWLALARPKVERWFHSRALRSALADELARERFDLVHLDELFLARALPAAARTPVVVHHHKLDLEHFADLPGPRGFRRAFDLFKLARLERCAARRTRFHVTTSAEDARRLTHRHPELDVAVVESGFDPRRCVPPVEARARDELLFLGSLDYAPNLDGLAWFVREVLPLLANARPGVRLAVVGSRPGPEARALAFERVTIVGAVPDVVPHLQRASLLVIPLRQGGGTRLKLVEAAACATPIVSTRVGAEGLAFQDGEHLALADTAAHFARAVLDVLGDPRRAAERAERARALALERYTWGALGGRLLAAWERAARG